MFRKTMRIGNLQPSDFNLFYLICSSVNILKTILNHAINLARNNKSGLKRKAGHEGVEPPTNGLRVRRSTWLSQWPVIGYPNG